MFVFLSSFLATKGVAQENSVNIREYPPNFWGKVIASDDPDTETETIYLTQSSDEISTSSPTSGNPGELLLHGHTAAVQVAEFGAGGGKFFTGGNDRNIFLWDLKSGEILKRYRMHKNPVIGISANRNADMFLSVSKDRTGILWSTESETPVNSFESPSRDAFQCISMTRDGRSFVTGSEKGHVFIWNREKCEPRAKRLGHTGVVTSIKYSSSGACILATSRDKKAIIWKADGTNERPSCVFEEHKGLVLCGDISTDDSRAITGGTDKLAYIWDTTTGGVIRRLEGHEADIVAVAFNPTASVAATAAKDRKVIFWEVSSGKILSTYDCGEEPLANVFWTPDFDLMALVIGGNGVENRKVRVIKNPLGNLSSVTVVSRNIPEKLVSEKEFEFIPEKTDNIPLRGHTETTPQAFFSRNGAMIGTISNDATAILFDTKTRANVQTINSPNGRLTAGTFGIDGKFMLGGTSSGQTLLFEVASGETRHRLSGHNGSVRSVAINSAGSRLLTTGSDKSALLWDTKKLEQPLGKFNVHSGPVNKGIFSPDGKLIVTCSDDRTVVVIDEKSKTPLQALRAHTDEVTDVAFSPDGKILASASRDNSVILWNYRTGVPINRIRLPVACTSVEFYPHFAAHGTAIMAIGTTEGVVSWSLQKMQPIRSYRRHDGPITEIKFNPEGTLMISCGGTEPKLWDIRELQSLANPPTR